MSYKSSEAHASGNPISTYNSFQFAEVLLVKSKKRKSRNRELCGEAKRSHLILTRLIIALKRHSSCFWFQLRKSFTSDGRVIKLSAWNLSSPQHILSARKRFRRSSNNERQSECVINHTIFGFELVNFQQNAFAYANKYKKGAKVSQKPVHRNGKCVEMRIKVAFIAISRQ